MKGRRDRSISETQRFFKNQRSDRVLYKKKNRVWRHYEINSRNAAG